MTNTEAVQTTLNTVEKELRNKIFALAEANDYSGISFHPDYRIAGESLQKGLNSRWLNVLRLKSLLAKGECDYLFVCTELSRQDMETLKAVHKAMPE